MSVARVTELTSESPESFEAAIKEGIARAHETLRGVKGAWIKEQRVVIENGNVTAYHVDMLVTFILD